MVGVPEESPAILLVLHLRRRVWGRARVRRTSAVRRAVRRIVLVVRLEDCERLLRAGARVVAAFGSLDGGGDFGGGAGRVREWFWRSWKEGVPVEACRAAVFGIHFGGLEGCVGACQGQGDGDEGGELHFGVSDSFRLILECGFCGAWEVWIRGIERRGSRAYIYLRASPYRPFIEGDETTL